MNHVPRNSLPSPNRGAIVGCALLFALCGGTLAHPGVVMDRLLLAWGWSPAQFGTGVMLMGLFAWLGTKIIGQVQDPWAPKVRPLAPASAAIGLVLLYAANYPWPGFAFVGFGVGGSTMLGNSLIVRMSGASRKLSIVNMCFTAGAVVLPTLTATWLNYLSSEANPKIEDTWKFVPLAIATLFFSVSLIPALLLKYFPTGAQRTNEKLSASASSEKATPVPHLPGLGFASVALFCYLGTEINLSNHWMTILQGHFSVPEDAARLANPIFWSGLLFIRTLFSIWHPSDDNIFLWLKGLGWLSVFLVALTVLFSLLSDRGFAGPSLTGPLLGLCFLSGFSVGSSYSFIVALVAVQQRKYLESGSPKTSSLKCSSSREHQISNVLAWGIGGSIILPLLMGLAVERYGPRAGLCLVLISQIVFTTAVIQWAKTARQSS